MNRIYLVSSTFKGCLEEPELFESEEKGRERFDRLKSDDNGDAQLSVLAVDSSGFEIVVIDKHSSERF